MTIACIPMTIVQEFGSVENFSAVLVQPSRPDAVEHFARKRGLTVQDAMRVWRAIEIASNATGVHRGEILSHQRTARIIVARHLAYAEARSMGLSYLTIGRAFQRDHTTIMHGVRKHEGAA